MQPVPPRHVLGFVKPSRDHSVDRMLLDRPGSHFGDHAGAHDRSRGAVGCSGKSNRQLTALRSGGH
jgi:hypothetical protein